MNDLVFAGNKALYLVLLMSAWPIIVATAIGLLVGLFQTVTQLQEQTLPFGIKLFGVSLCLFLLSGWYGETLLGFGREVMRMALARGLRRMQFGLFFEIHGWVAAAALGFARVAPVFFILPFLNSNVLSGVVRTSATMLVALGLWPHPVEALPAFQALPFLALIAREVAVGLLLGRLLAWPFWVFHALGSIIDNQRGATLSSSIDPANGVDTSELANLFNLFAAAVYLQGGGMGLMLDLFRQSYQLCDPLGVCAPALTPTLSLLNQVISKAVVLASPVVAALLLSEAVLGLLSRFAPQMNAFAVSLTVKSAVALLIMLMYFGPVLPDTVARLVVPAAALPGWLGAPVR